MIANGKLNSGENKLSVNSLYVTGNSAQKVTGNSAQFARGEVPKDVGYDPTLSMAAKAVYVILATAERNGGYASIGIRRIAKYLGAHKETVGLALNELQAAKHITVTSKHGARNAYHLTHPHFATRKPKSDSKPRCSKCEKMSNTINQTGWCFSCRTRVELLADLRSESAA